MDLRLEGRSIVVTGASSGIGLAAARVLLEEHASVTTCARDFKRLADAYRGLEGDQAERLLLMRCDVRNREEVQQLIDAAAIRFGALMVSSTTQDKAAWERSWKRPTRSGRMSCT